jgi:hypothetical protein
MGLLTFCLCEDGALLGYLPASSPESTCTIPQLKSLVLVPVPRDMPADYSALMQRCWASDPSHRPDFSAVLNLLEGSSFALHIECAVSLELYPGPVG